MSGYRVGSEAATKGTQPELSELKAASQLELDRERAKTKNLTEENARLAGQLESVSRQGVLPEESDDGITKRNAKFWKVSDELLKAAVREHFRGS
eukprot:4251791-Pyramimonas_sp.AAC.2